MADSAPAGNPRLDLLQPYPFERLRALLAGAAPDPALKPVNLSIGEPKHPTPAVIRDAIVANLDGLSSYPATTGSDALRAALGGWLVRRHGLEGLLDAKRHVLPVNGSREALFAFAQVVIDPEAAARTDRVPRVVCPNPFYQIYEGAALLAGARPFLVAQEPSAGHACDWAAVPEDVWRDTRLLYVCSPGNPTGRVMRLEEWKLLFDLADRHGFVIASDECYSEIWFDAPPLGALEAAKRLGRTDFARLMVFGSLSKRSNAPGLRSGYVAGDAALIARFLLYRTYHGSAMSPVVQAASIAAWNDEAHVEANRAAYREKFDRVTPIVARELSVERPDAGFYLWADIGDRFGGDDAAFARALHRDFNVLVLPGSFLGRPGPDGRNPAAGRVRIALVDGVEACVEAAERLAAFAARAPR